MKLFYDLRLGYLVAAPGQETPLASLQAKAGDGEEVILQFGRSSDPTASSVIVDAPTWTKENLAGGTLITIGIKEDDKYSDGDILASSSTFTHNSGAYTYTFALDLNTTEINTAMERGDANDADDVAELDCGFEVTFQVGGSGGWRSSVLPVPFTLYHDILFGDEATPTNAGDPDEYLLKASAVEFYPTVTSLIGGTSADLDAVPTVGVTVGKMVQFLDTDPTPDIVRYYRLEAGTDAESSPNVIRPDDYDGSTNAKVWKLYVGSPTGLSNPMNSVGDLIRGGASGVETRLAIGTTGQVLKVAGGVPTWSSDNSAYPSSVATQSSNFSLVSGDNGQLINLDGSSGTVAATIQDNMTHSYDDNTHFWIMASNTANACTIAWSGLVVVGRTSPITLTQGVPVHLWRETNDIWYVI